MAMSCVNGVSECTGCMKCQEEAEPIYCEYCGERLDDYVYEDEIYNNLCLDCLVLLHSKEIGW